MHDKSYVPNICCNNGTNSRGKKEAYHRAYNTNNNKYLVLEFQFLLGIFLLYYYIAGKTQRLPEYYYYMLNNDRFIHSK